MKHVRGIRLKLVRGAVTECRAACGGFTLAEVLAAMLFMAIVIPAAVEGIRLAHEAGQVALRKTVAAQVAERVLNELVVTRQWQQGPQQGVVVDGPFRYEWRSDLENWVDASMYLLTVQVTYTVQGRARVVELATLVTPNE